MKKYIYMQEEIDFDGLSNMIINVICILKESTTCDPTMCLDA